MISSIRQLVYKNGLESQEERWNKKLNINVRTAIFNTCLEKNWEQVSSDINPSARDITVMVDAVLDKDNYGNTRVVLDAAYIVLCWHLLGRSGEVSSLRYSNLESRSEGIAVALSRRKNIKFKRHNIVIHREWWQLCPFTMLFPIFVLDGVLSAGSDDYIFTQVPKQSTLITTTTEGSVQNNEAASVQGKEAAFNNNVGVSKYLCDLLQSIQSKYTGKVFRRAGATLLAFEKELNINHVISRGNWNATGYNTVYEYVNVPDPSDMETAKVLSGIYMGCFLYRLFLGWSTRAPASPPNFDVDVASLSLKNDDGVFLDGTAVQRIINKLKKFVENWMPSALDMELRKAMFATYIMRLNDIEASMESSLTSYESHLFPKHSMFGPCEKIFTLLNASREDGEYGITPSILRQISAHLKIRWEQNNFEHLVPIQV